MTDDVSPRYPGGHLRFALILAGIQLGGAFALTFASKQGLIDADVTTRGVMVLIGLSLAAVGNRMPKSTDGQPPQSLRQAAIRQSVLRVGGWSMLLSGLAFAGFWAFAPRDVALTGSVVAVLVGMAITLVNCIWRASQHTRP